MSVSFLGHRVDIYSVTHTVHSLNGSKSHTVRETQMLDNIETLKDWNSLNPVRTSSKVTYNRLSAEVWLAQCEYHYDTLDQKIIFYLKQYHAVRSEM